MLRWLPLTFSIIIYDIQIQIQNIYNSTKSVNKVKMAVLAQMSQFKIHVCLKITLYILQENDGIEAKQCKYKKKFDNGKQ